MISSLIRDVAQRFGACSCTVAEPDMPDTQLRTRMQHCTRCAPGTEKQYIALLRAVAQRADDLGDADGVGIGSLPALFGSSHGVDGTDGCAVVVTGDQFHDRFFIGDGDIEACNATGMQSLQRGRESGFVGDGEGDIGRVDVRLTEKLVLKQR